MRNAEASASLYQLVYFTLEAGALAIHNLKA